MGHSKLHYFFHKLECNSFSHSYRGFCMTTYSEYLSWNVTQKKKSKYRVIKCTGSACGSQPCTQEGGLDLSFVSTSSRMSLIKHFTYVSGYGVFTPAMTVVSHPGIKNVNVPKTPTKEKIRQYFAACLHTILWSSRLIK